MEFKSKHRNQKMYFRLGFNVNIKKCKNVEIIGREFLPNPLHLTTTYSNL